MNPRPKAVAFCPRGVIMIRGFMWLNILLKREELVKAKRGAVSLMKDSKSTVFFEI
jgi:hypothetical protein